MADLTIIYCSAQKIPPKFAATIVERLKIAAGDYPIYYAIDPPEQSSIINYYRTLLEVARAIDTPYIAIAEDDTLYPDEHFNYRSDVFAYNFNRWNIHAWSDPPFYSLRQRKILATLICPRQLFIDAVEEKFKVDPQGKKLQWWGEPGRANTELRLGVTPRPSETFETYNPVVVFSHEDSFGYESTGKNKRSSRIRALDLPYHGRASDIMKLYKE